MEPRRRNRQRVPALPRTGEIASAGRPQDRPGSFGSWACEEAQHVRSIQDLHRHTERLRCGGLGRAGLDEAAGWTKRARSALNAYEARLLTAANRAFDGGAAGAELMRTAAGCSQREARRRARRAETLADMPAVAQALSDGAITAEHADALVKAAEATSTAAVDADPSLLAKAESLPADLAARRSRIGLTAANPNKTAKPSSAASGRCAATEPGSTPTACSTPEAASTPSPAPASEPSSTTPPTVSTEPTEAETAATKSAPGTSATPTP